MSVAPLPPSGPPPGATLRWLAATGVAWLFVDAAFAVPAHAGASTFGNPPELAAVWLLCAAGWASAIARAPDRLAVARRLALALLLSTLLDRRCVPADVGLRLALLGVTLWAAAPWLRLRAGAGATLLALALAMPGVLLGELPQGGLLWLAFTLPAAALALLVPALFPGRHAARVVLALLLATTVACAAALATYPVLARGLDLPLAVAGATRLHLLGLHPNLAVPHLATTLVLGCALLLGSRGRSRAGILLALLPVVAALLAIRSRTGLLACVLGLGLLGLSALPGRLASALHRVALAGVAALLVFPLTGLSDGSIRRDSASMVSKAVSFRSAMWELGRDTLAAAPWHGHGPGTSYVQGRHARRSRYDGLPKDDHPHNVLLATGGALGWPGLLALALLFVAGSRRPRAGGFLAHAAAAAALATWAANAIDMGGAEATYYPALAFLLLGLAQAAPRPDVAGHGAPPRAGSRRAAAGLGAALGLLGLLLLAGEACERAAARRLDTDPRAEVGGLLAWAARLQPLDPAVPLLAVRAADARGDRDAAERSLARARELFPASPALAHRRALQLAAFNPADPRVAALLQEALDADPLGADAWRRYRDLAQVRALVGDGRGALEALTQAVLLDPAAAAGLAQRVVGEALELLPGGPAGAAVPLSGLLDAIATGRAGLARDDPASETRLRMREVEVLRALGQTASADQAARELLAEDQLYLARQLAQSAIARNAPEEALARLREVGYPDNSWAAVDLVVALAHAAPADEAAYRAALDGALDTIRRTSDLVFELPNVVRLLEARRAWAERHGDAASALRLADALAFAAR